jgi:Spy/CpxP family protein refolding chaperone
MKPKFLLIIAAMASAVFIGSWVYAGGMGGSMGGGMGSGGNGMMGGGSMMGSGQGYSNPWQDYQDKAKETETLRQEIREKRQELSELFRSDKPDKRLIDQKVDELSKLESDLDRRLSGSQFQRR